MSANVGDRIVIESNKVGVSARRGEIVEVIAHEVRPEYRVRWDDGHESTFRPTAGTVHVARARRSAKG